MELVQSRLVTNDVTGYGKLSTRRWLTRWWSRTTTTSKWRPLKPSGSVSSQHALLRLDARAVRAAWRGMEVGAVILDFAVDDLDAEHDRIWGLDVDWLMLPTLQPWGRRSMMLRDPEGHLINVFEKKEGDA